MLPESEIGENIRKIRKSKGLTLESLAKKTGISKGYFSKLENSDKAPPVSTMLNIAEALQVRISYLFGEKQKPISVSLVKKGERQLMARNGARFGYSYETLAHKFPHKRMEPYILTIPSGVDEYSLFQHEGEEMLLMLEGRTRFVLGDDEYQLEEGDCLYFDSGVPHRGFALDGREVKALMVIFAP